MGSGRLFRVRRRVLLGIWFHTLLGLRVLVDGWLPLEIFALC